MRTWYTTDFAGHYPIGASAVVVAKDKEQAHYHLKKAIEGAGLKYESAVKTGRRPELTELGAHTQAVVLHDGNY